MTLHAVVYQQHQDLPFGIHHHHHNNPSLYDHLINHDDGFYEHHHDHHQPMLFDYQYDDTFNFPFCNNDQSSLVDAQCFDWSYDDDQQMWGPNSTTLRDPQAADVGIDKDDDGEKVRPKRRRTRMKKKNKEDIESQRMTHIAVERNRRKQMNDYLTVLRSLMPHSYVPRGDQASIIGGAINFVKELEQNLHCLTAAKNQMNYENNEGNNNNYVPSSNSLPFGEFFTFPQYSTTTGGGGGDSHSSGDDDGESSVKGSMSHHLHHHGRVAAGGGLAADVEVTMVESHALIKIRTIQPPKQLSKLVSGLQGLGLNILHLNATKVDGVAFYSFSVKVENEGRLSSVDEIASAVYQLLSGLQ